MENNRIIYCDSSNSPKYVRVLTFNGNINIYDDAEENFIVSFPLKGSVVHQKQGKLLVYFDSSKTQYIELMEEHPQSGVLLNDVKHANDNFFNRLVRQRVLVVGVVLMVFIVGMYMLLITLVPTIGATLISKDSERRIGEQLYHAMLKEEEIFGASIDTQGTQSLQLFADKLQLSQDYPLTFTLLNSAVVNAYALPGGHIVVYSGMVSKIKDHEALVALLAHEATHINERHSLRSMLRSAAEGMIVSVLFGDASGIAASLVSHAETLRGLEYSRSIEDEADDRGMRLMLRNDVNVSGMKRLMQILQKEGDVPGNVSFLSSHPLTGERIRNAEEFAREHPQSQSSRADLSQAFQKLKGAR